MCPATGNERQTESNRERKRGEERETCKDRQRKAFWCQNILYCICGRAKQLKAIAHQWKRSKKKTEREKEEGKSNYILQSEVKTFWRCWWWPTENFIRMESMSQWEMRGGVAVGWKIYISGMCYQFGIALNKTKPNGTVRRMDAMSFVGYGMLLGQLMNLQWCRSTFLRALFPLSLFLNICIIRDNEKPKKNSSNNRLSTIEKLQWGIFG